MIITNIEVVNYINELLEPHLFKDYCPNGLQVAGSEHVSHIVTGVTASRALIQAAIERQADTLLVHHGYLWRNDDLCITKMKRERLKLLLEHNINLIAYHLPLDAHLIYGNNAQLARILDFEVMGNLKTDSQPPIIFTTHLSKAISAENLVKHITNSLKRKPLHLAGTRNPIKSIAWCSGGAQGFAETVAYADYDAYISGEVSESTYHVVKETGMHYFAIGHHASERYGVQALGEHVAQCYDLAHCFVDIPNPI